MISRRSRSSTIAPCRQSSGAVCQPPGAGAFSDERLAEQFSGVFGASVSHGHFGKADAQRAGNCVQSLGDISESDVARAR
jgi:hypothetical protein